jgi:pyruvate/oxaloacetate carboxyltransferase
MEKNSNGLSVIVAGTIVVCTAMVSTVFYNLNDRNNMSKNIESAISKGVDPLSVKCAYEVTPNAICITYAANRK